MCFLHSVCKEQITGKFVHIFCP